MALLRCFSSHASRCSPISVFVHGRGLVSRQEPLRFTVAATSGQVDHHASTLQIHREHFGGACDRSVGASATEEVAVAALVGGCTQVRARSGLGFGFAHLHSSHTRPSRIQHSAHASQRLWRSGGRWLDSFSDNRYCCGQVEMLAGGLEGKELA